MIVRANKAEDRTPKLCLIESETGSTKAAGSVATQKGVVALFEPKTQFATELREPGQTLPLAVGSGGRICRRSY